MPEYIATFHSHYASMRYKKLCDKHQIAGKIMPVPRSLSSSCGTCVGYTAENYLIDDSILEELEQIVQVENQAYIVVYEV